MTEAVVPDLVKPFLGRIGFTYSVAKGRSCLDWARRTHPDISWNGLVLALLYAEASHLRAYGRPVTGAAYRFDGDEVSSADLSMSALVQMPARLGEECLPEEMSRSDAWEIEAAVRKIRDAGSGSLAAKAATWRSGDSVDYALMVDVETQHAEELLSDLAYFGRHIAF